MDSLTAADMRTVGEFRLLARLGAGGMGQVFLASSLAGRVVAVKVIHAEHCRDPEFVRRFRGEVEAAQRVSGWYTAPVVAAGVDDTPPWLATAFVPGPPLDDIVSRHGPLPVAAVWRLAAGLAEALRAIHGTGLVHRDLKPANVLMAPDGPRVIDFGISRAVADTRLTASGAIIGTPSYMSPEQVEGATAGPASDIFSLGSVLAFAATGNGPFNGAPGMSAAAVMYRVVHGAANLDGVPADLRSLIEACLAKDPSQRPDLARVAAGSTTAAERLGLSPAAFWPPEVSGVIQAQQAALTAQIAALSGGAAPDIPGTSGPAGVPTGTPAGPSTGYASPLPGGTTRPSAGGGPYQAGYPGASYPSGPGYPSGSGYPSSPGGGPTAPPGGGASGLYTAGGGRAGGRHGGDAGGGYGGQAGPGVSRRSLLIGGGAGGVAVIGGVLGWVLSRSGPGAAAGAASPTGAGGLPTTLPTPSAGSSTARYYGEGPTRTAAWKFATGNAIQGTPGVANGLAYVGSTDKTVYAVKTADGTKAWSFAADVNVAPEVIGGVVCLVTTDGHFYALNAKTGARAWDNANTGASAQYKRTWAVNGGDVIFSTESDGLRAWDAATGARGVAFATKVPYAWTLTVADGVLYALDLQGTLYAFHADTGSQIWSKALLAANDPVGTGLVVDGGTVYLGTNSGTLYAVSAATGQQQWTYKPGSGMSSGLLVDGGLLYVEDNNGTLHAVDTATRKDKWARTGVQSSVWGPALDNGRIYYTTFLALQALDAKTGAPQWRFLAPAGQEFLSTPAIADGLVMIGCGDDSLYAVKA